MKIGAGYRQTEVGVIPKDWEIMSFFQAVRSYIDYRGRTPRKLGLSWGGGDILALSANNVQMGRIDRHQEAYFGSEELYRRWMFPEECEPKDVLLTMEAPLGNVAQIPDQKKYILSQRVLLIKPKVWLLRDYLAHYMRGEFFQQQLALNATGTTARGIQRRKLDQLTIYLPPTEAEQVAIAEALSDADALIDSLDQLLAKKRQIKKGTLQELLTGTRRLPGFQGKWEARPLGAEITALDAGISVNSTDIDADPESVAILKTSSLDGGVFVPTECKRIMAKDLHRAKLNPRAKTILISRMNTIDLVGECGYVDEDYPNLFVPDRLWLTRFRSEAGASPRWLSYLLSSESYRAQLKAVATGTSGSMKNIAKSALLSLKITFPPLPEQAAIAAVLTDMDVEITALEEKLAKNQKLKQGMMEELLTGRIRLA
jgi:type I restriction enzyme S subunit